MNPSRRLTHAQHEMRNDQYFQISDTAPDNDKTAPDADTLAAIPQALRARLRHVKPHDAV
jgi:hypothetical protein